MTTSSASSSTTPTSVVPHADTMIAVATQAFSFQTREVLQRIVSAEQQRIRQEQMLWRLGGALVGACLGLGDGFQPQDLFLGMGMSGLAGLGHDVMSHEQRRFLESCHSLWTVGTNSPVELMARLGQARSRVLLYATGWHYPLIYAHHQGVRGETLVPLGIARDHAKGFQNSKSMEVLQRYFDGQELKMLENQLYPDAQGAVQLKGLQPVSTSEARQLDPHAGTFLPGFEPVYIETATGAAVGYRTPIPVHSDF